MKESGLKIYLSGPMTGMPDNNVAAFRSEQKQILSCFPDAVIVNPAADKGYRAPCISRSCQRTHLDYRATILRDLSILQTCNVLWLLPGFEKSLGSQIEISAFNCGEANLIPRYRTLDVRPREPFLKTIVFPKMWPNGYMSRRWKDLVGK